MKKDRFSILSKKQTQVKPFIYKKSSVSEILIRMLCLFFIQILMLFFTQSYSALLVVGVALIGALSASALDYLITKSHIYSYLTLLVQGIMIGLLLPESYPPITVFFLSFSVLFVFKYFFSNSENTWINMVALAIVISWFIGKSFFPSYLITKELLPVKNPSYYLIQNGTFPVYQFDSNWTSFLNTHFFNYLKISLPDGYLSLMWDSHSVIPAFRFNLLTIFSSILLFADGAFSILISTVYLFTYCLLVRLFVPFMNGGIFNQGDIFLALFTGGTLFCATFMIQWMGTTPFTLSGKIIYGFIAGVLSFVLMGCGTSPVEMVYIVLLCNIINLIINLIEERHCKKALIKVVEKANI